MLLNSFDLKFLSKVIFNVLPAVNIELEHWWKKSCASPDDVLRRLAQNSLKYKKFHAQGGAVYASRYEGNNNALTRIIVAFQTISDYLDNLCDRAGCFDEKAFRQLHASMIDALCPGSELKDYYKYYPLSNDGGYLHELVKVCRKEIVNLPSYGLVQSRLIYYVTLYSNLQVYKHVALEKREALLTKWITPLLLKYPGIYWWEFAAAAGSTLAIFALLSSALQQDLTIHEIDKIDKAYFPWICGLHILLDYYIDQEEDLLENDFNFVSYYPDSKMIRNRFRFFIKQSIAKSETLPDKFFHITIVKGLLALYLSDPKAVQQKIRDLSLNILREGGSGSLFIYRLCLLFRRLGIV